MRQSALLIIFLVVFMDLVGFGIVLPVLPYYAQSYGASAWKLGLLLSIFSVMNLVATPILGRLSDRVGRRPVLLLTILGNAFSLLLLGLAGSLKWLFVARILGGISSANIPIAHAYAADVTSGARDRAKGAGLIGAAFGLGIIFGPALGGILSRYGFDIPMYVGATLAFLNLFFALIKLEEPRVDYQTRSANRTRVFDLETFRLSLADGRIRFAIGVSFLAALALSQVEAVLAIYLGARFQYNAEEAGILLAVLGLVMVGAQAGLLGRLVRELGEAKLVAACAALGSLALAFFASASAIELMVIALCLFALADSLLQPTLSARALEGSAGPRRSALQGIHHSTLSIARIVGPPVAGWLYDRMSWRSPFWGGSLALALAFFLALLVLLGSPEPQRR